MTSMTAKSLLYRFCVHWTLITVTSACAAGPASSKQALSATSCAGNPSNIADTTIYDSTSVSEKPILRTSGPVPTYPPDLMAHGIEGGALFDVVIAVTGVIDSSTLRATAGRQEFISAAKQTVLGTRFWPACVGNRPVRYHAVIPVNFAIRR